MTYFFSDFDINTAQKMMFTAKDFFSKYEQIHSFMWIFSYLLKESLLEN